MKTQTAAAATGAVTSRAAENGQATAMRVLIALSLSHMINDTLQAILPAVYPLMKEQYALTFTQIGMITFTFQVAGSIFQPLIGFYTDKRPQPKSLAFGMCLSCLGVAALAFATGYRSILMAAVTLGLGSAIFHPESSRMARLASGGRHGFAQSLFQVGGNAGTALGPLLAAWIIVPRGQRWIVAFTGLAVVGAVVLSRVGNWYAQHLSERSRIGAVKTNNPRYSNRVIAVATSVLLVLMFSKFFYLVSFTNYYTFYLIGKFGVTVQQSQLYLFLFLASVAAGTIVGGPIGDRIGRRAVIWVSILGIAPFALILPHVNLFWTAVLAGIAGFMMASAFPAILVYATEMLPGSVGLVAGLFFGVAFGLAGIGSALLGKLADATSIVFVMKMCAYLPLLGMFTVFLPRPATAERTA